MSLLAILFWFCFSGILYIYAGYPALIGLLTRFFSKDVQKGPNTYSITVIIAIYNDAGRLRAKLENILASDQSERIAQILIGSDGSDDDPAGAIQDMNDSRIQLICLPERRGKPSVLNDLITTATGDILVMMDVRQRLDSKAIPALLENFSDPMVGVVSGELMFEQSENDTSAAEGIGAYWRYEKWIRNQESRLASVPGATGALYAIRRELARPIPAAAALDDVIIPMLAIKLGFRCIFEPGAKIYDRPAQEAAREAVRKRRTLAGCVQLLRLYPLWIFPGGHPIWWQFASHKILRMFSPLLAGGALAFNLCLINHPLYRVFAMAQCCLWILGIYSALKSDTARGLFGRIAGLMGMFLMMQYYTLLAWSDGIRYRNLALWKKA